MPDYSACTNRTCGQRAFCARYLMVWSTFRQSISDFAPDPETGVCRDQMPTKDPVTGRPPFPLIPLEQADDRYPSDGDKP